MRFGLLLGTLATTCAVWSCDGDDDQSPGSGGNGGASGSATGGTAGVTADAGDASEDGAIDAPVVDGSDAKVDAGPVPTAEFTDSYFLEESGNCTRDDLTTLQNGTAHAPRIIGYAPTTTGVKYPLFLWTGGTFSDYAAPGSTIWLQEMASRGFVAASLEYDNGIPLGCTSHALKATCAYDGKKAGSAVAKLCARADVDCDKGIVTAGHSQGAGMAVVAKNHDDRVRATWMLGASCDNFWDTTNGACNPNGADDQKCLLDVNTVIPGDRVRIINGDRDEYGDQLSYERITGKTCPADTLDCLSANGSGWYLIPSEEVEDFHGPYDPSHTGWGAEHCFWINSIDGQWCPAEDAAHPPDKNWLPPASLPWSLSPNLDWLKSFVDPPS